MALDELRRKIEALNRAPLPPAETDQPPSPASSVTSGAIRRCLQRRPTELEHLIDGHELTVGTGRCFQVGRALSRCWPANPRIGPDFASALEQAAKRTDAVDPDLVPGLVGGVGSLLFTDLETCGFAGTPVFLIGLMLWEGGDLYVEQLLARNYEEEPAILNRFAQRLRQSAAGSGLVTFNGKSFDWPFLCDRAAVCRVELPQPRFHCDLLHAARRRYRHELPDCRLQTLELFLCRRRRTDDIPGAEIPGAYHDFVRTKDARAIRQIVHHNFLDLVTLAEVLATMLQPRHLQQTD